jgi:hypothetical protein
LVTRPVASALVTDRFGGRAARAGIGAVGPIPAAVCSNDAMKTWLPWLAVLALIMVLSLRPLATAVAIGWLGYCAWTWIRAARAARNGDRAG